MPGGRRRAGSIAYSATNGVHGYYLPFRVLGRCRKPVRILFRTSIWITGAMDYR